MLHALLSKQKGATPLHLAAYKGHVDVVQVLLKANAEVNMQLEVCTCRIYHGVHVLTGASELSK